MIRWAVLAGMVVASLVRAEAPRARAPVTADQVKRVSTAVPFPRGLALVDGQLYVLARGRVRESGGASGEIDDRAGSIYRIDPDVAQPIMAMPVSEAVKRNGEVFAAPTQPPFRLFDRTVNPPTRDRETDRPYCTLRYDAATKNFYICAFSGIDKAPGGGSSFSKNLNDGVLRYDTRTHTWHEVERHNIEAGGIYPHHDPASRPPPHGWLNGPDNCLVVGHWMYVVAKDNSLLVRYDLRAIAADADAPAPPSYWVLDHKLLIEQADGAQKLKEFHGHSMLAERDGYLYVGYRTSSVIVRFPLEEDGQPKQPIVGQVVARFDSWDPQTRRSANLTDMVFGPEGDIYVVSAQPAAVHRFPPDPSNAYDARGERNTPWADLAGLTNNPQMKSENVLVDQRGRVFITSGDAYAADPGYGGVIYRIDPKQ